MTEKVIGIKIDFKVSETGNFIAITKDSLIPVVLKSVYYTALKKKNKRIKKLLQIINTKEVKKK